MAIYHFSVKIISRANGSRALASAAYRSASRLHDERLDRAHDFSNKAGVIHSEVMLPDGAPEDWRDREKLWNAVEAAEKRKDAELAREVEFAIPREMSRAQGIDLARDFVADQFVSRGMIADLNVHWDIGSDGMPKPHAHVMLTMREVGEDGFGAKARDWNRTEHVEQWRAAWATHVNQRLAELDIDAAIDHRSLEAQGIDLEPQNKIGPAASRMADIRLEMERIAEHHAIAQRNGDKIIAHPALALEAITHGQATFTRRDLAMFVHRHSDGKEQYDRAMAAVEASPDLISLGKDGRGEDRFTSRAMIDTEQRLQQASLALADRHDHAVSAQAREHALMRAGTRGMILSSEQQSAFDHVTQDSGLGVVIGYAGTGKSAMLGVAKEAWEESGFRVHGLALSGIAAENLETGSGIAARTIAGQENQWALGRDLPSSSDVFVIDEAGMVGTRQLERLLSCIRTAGAKIVLVGDPQQLQAIEAGAAFRSVVERHGGVEITDIRRQRDDWQRDATRHLATDRTGEAIRAYAEREMVHEAVSREAARSALIDRWDDRRIAEPNGSRIILTHTKDEVRLLNDAARDRLRTHGDLGQDVRIRTEGGERIFAAGDRVMFLRNERSLGVKNGTLGWVENLTAMRMAVLLDDGRTIVFDIKDYAHIDHGYAATIHKAQGMTVDRTHILATPGLDSHAAYVALSRHRHGIDLHYGHDDFADSGKLIRTLSRERPKNMAQDYERQFAERRGIRFGERVREAVDKVKNIFAGFRPPPRLEPLPQDKGADLSSEMVLQRKAVERYARALVAMDLMQEKNLPVLAHQRQELERAGASLDHIRQHARQDLQSAFSREPALIQEAASGRSQQALTAMALEAEVRTNPTMRADRFIQKWAVLRRQREKLERAGDERGMRRVSQSMAGMAKSIERDPQLDSILRNRRIALGMAARSEGGISFPDELTETVGLPHSRHRGLSL